MRTALCMAIGLALGGRGVPASLAQDSRVPDHAKPAGTGIEAEERQTHQQPGSNTGISLAVPIGRVSVGHELDGEAVYVRRTTVRVHDNRGSFHKALRARPGLQRRTSRSRLDRISRRVGKPNRFLADRD